MPQEEDEEEAVTKKAIKELEIFVSQILYNFFLFISFFQLLYFITFFYTFFTHDIYPHPHTRPTPSTLDPRHLATLNILYAPENPALCKPIGLTLSVMTWQVHVTCFQDTNADSVIRVVSTLHSQQLLFLLTPLEDTWMLGCVFSGKSKSGFPNPNTDFEFFWANPKTNHESIKSTLRVDSSDQIQIQIFEIHNLSVFLGKDLKKVFLTSGFSKK